MMTAMKLMPAVAATTAATIATTVTTVTTLTTHTTLTILTTLTTATAVTTATTVATTCTLCHRHFPLVFVVVLAVVAVATRIVCVAVFHLLLPMATSTSMQLTSTNAGAQRNGVGILYIHGPRRVIVQTSLLDSQLGTARMWSQPANHVTGREDSWFSLDMELWFRGELLALQPEQWQGSRLILSTARIFQISCFNIPLILPSPTIRLVLMLMACSGHVCKEISQLCTTCVAFS